MLHRSTPLNPAAAAESGGEEVQEPALFIPLPIPLPGYSGTDPVPEEPSAAAASPKPPAAGTCSAEAGGSASGKQPAATAQEPRGGLGSGQPATAGAAGAVEHQKPAAAAAAGGGNVPVQRPLSGSLTSHALVDLEEEEEAGEGAEAVELAAPVPGLSVAGQVLRWLSGRRHLAEG